MINAEERAICERRGHDGGLACRGEWTQCRWCGVWRREVVSIEEREDDPPDKERSPFDRLRREVKKVEKLKDGREDPPAE